MVPGAEPERWWVEMLGQMAVSVKKMLQQLESVKYGNRITLGIWPGLRNLTALRFKG